ncbi:MAG: sugar phosphate nucleotidyltransferase [Ignavibacteria bacterium]|nr:sugar phosphate nucleotidyltransferase [Ignavibacteria bacterium]
MPVTDTNFNNLNSAIKEQKLAELMKSLSDKENLKQRLATVILAAGLGKRMKSPDKPKVMFEINGKPMIQYVTELAFSVESDIVIPIVGHHREKVTEFLDKRFPDREIRYAVQEEQLGTGHAVMQTEGILRDFSGEVLILSGDVPLLSRETVKKLIRTHFEGKYLATMLTAEFRDPYGYGRILRDENGRFIRIVEEKDATEDQKKIREINPAIYIVNSSVLFDCLKKIKPDNNQNEYYLTDIFNFIPCDKIGTVSVNDELEVTGVNSIEQLREIEEALSNTLKT